VRQAQGDAACSDHRDGCRPPRSAPHAVAQAQPSIAEGDRGVVDRDLETCCDRVNQDQLRGTLAKRRQETRVWTRIRGCLQAGVLELGQPDRRGDPARRPPVAPGSEPGAGRMGSGT